MVAAASVIEDGEDSTIPVVEAASMTEDDAAELTAASEVAVDAPRVTVTNVTEQAESSTGVEEAKIAIEVGVASEVVIEADVEAGAADDAEPEDPPPKVKVWLASPGAQFASSRTLADVIARHVPA